MTIDVRSLELFVDFVRKNSWLPGNDPAMMRAFNAYTKVEGYDVDLTGLKEVIEDVPEVEVSASLRSSSLVAVSERPVERRRSGAKNVSDSHLQNAFIDEARHAMGQPSKTGAEDLIGCVVTLRFNVDLPDKTGVLTQVVDHPANPNGPVYLILNDDRNIMYPLNSVQEIVKVQ